MKQNISPITENNFDLSIIIPCLNEELHIVPTLKEVEKAMSTLDITYEVIVINDGSHDKTQQEVEKFLNENLTFPGKIYENIKNKGLAQSYLDGAFLATGKYCLLISGDNVESAETIRSILAEMGKKDIVITYSKAIEGKPWHRLLISDLYTHLVNLLAGLSIRYYNGASLLKRYDVMRWSSRSFGFGFRADTLVRLIYQGATYKEVEVSYSHTVKPKQNSALNKKNFCSVTHTLLEIMIRRLRKILFNI